MAVRASGHARQDNRNDRPCCQGREGHILSAIELEKEKPPYMAGVGGLSNPEEVQIGIQISLIARFVPLW